MGRSRCCNCCQASGFWSLSWPSECPGWSSLQPTDQRFDLPPSTNDVQAQEPQVFKDGVPLPRPKPETALNGKPNGGPPEAAGAPLSLAPAMPPDSAELPATAQPASPASPSVGSSPIPDALKGVLGRIFDPNHAATWMALASGFAGAPSFGAGIGRAAGASVPAIAADRANELRMQSIQATYQSVYGELTRQGVPAGEAASKALAMAQNPELAKAMAPQVFGTNPPEWKEVGRDAIGNPIMGMVDVRRGTINGVPMAKWQAGDTGMAGAGVAGGPGGGAGGGTSVDPSLTGQAFLDAVSKNPKFGPGEASKVQGIAEGKIPYPTGFIMKTPYGRWLTNAVGQYEPGIDATKINQRRTFNTQLGSATPNSVGGQKTLMGTSLGHLAEVADAAVNLGNYAGGGVAPIAHWTNWAKNTVGTDAAARANALSEGVDRLSGEVGKLYSGNSGGGVNERESTRSRFGEAQSPPELAAGLEMSRDLIKSKLLALESQQDQIFGPNNPGRVDFLGANGRAALAKIDAAIAKLRGQSAPTSAAAPVASAAAAAPAVAPRVPPPGNYVYNPATRSLVPAQ